MPCAICDGTGDMLCKRCDGEGEVTCPDCEGVYCEDEPCSFCVEGEVLCPDCLGGGVLTCYACGGSGLTHQEEVGYYG